MAHRVPPGISPQRGEMESTAHSTRPPTSSLTSPADGEGAAAAGPSGGPGKEGRSPSPPKTCRRCGNPFSIFFNKRVICGGCNHSVCRKCAPWNSKHKAHVCGLCSKPPSGRGWGGPASPDESHLKEVEASVRSHIEALVENQVGGELDQVTTEANLSTQHPTSLDIDKISEDNKWDLLLYYYCYCHDRPLPPEDLPTSRHAQLSEDVTQAIKEAMILPPQVEGYDPAASPETPVEDFNSHTYEDILATAILNKVLETCEGERPDEVTIEVSHEVTSTDTDSGMSGGVKESRRRRGKRSEVSEAGSECSDERSITPQRSRTPPLSPDQGVVTDDSWAQAATGEGPPLQFKIEEHVEEITTHHLTDDEQDLEGFEEDDVSDSGGSWRGSRCSLDDSRGRPKRREKVSHHTAVAEDGLLSTVNIPLPDPSFDASRKVSFPELGADIIQDSCSDAECCSIGPGDMIVEADSWEQNWLFRRQKLANGGAADPINMLIPNPDTHVPATVGNRDVDELSELSERQSLCSGEPWSTSESEGEYDTRGDTYHTYTASKELSTLAGEIVAEFAQQDQEYTVDYSVPSRVTAASRSPEPISNKSKQPLLHHARSQGQSAAYNHVSRGGDSDFSVEGIKNPSARDNGFVKADPNFRSDEERPVPKPRKLSLANSPTSKTSVKSPVSLLPSPSEDLSILSPPLDMPHPNNACSNSNTVWFVGVPEDSTVMQGRTLRLVCQVNTKRPMGLSWYHNGSLVSMNSRDNCSWRKGSYHYLHIYSMTPDKAGIYAAAAYTATDCVWAFCRIEYKASSRPQKRPVFSRGLTDVTLEERTELQLQCQVTGHPEPRVVFSRGPEKLSPSPRISIESDQYGTWTLKVLETSVSDSGEISATATNSLAAISTKCLVRIVPEGMLITQNQGAAVSGNQRHSVNKQCELHVSSSNCHRPGKTGKHDSKSHNIGSSLLVHSSRSTQNIIHPLISANTDNSISISPDVYISEDDISDIHQVPTKPGTIAEREHRKWEAAVTLVNNPYAPEQLVRRLSNTRSSTQLLPSRHGIKVNFSEGGEGDLDPSLRKGVPPQADLNRYSRDYYVSSTSSKESSFMQIKKQQKLQESAYQPTEQSLPQKNSLPLTNGVQRDARGQQELAKNQVNIHIIGRENQNTSHFSVDTSVPSNRLENSADVKTSKPSDWKDELKDIQSARVEREVARFQKTINETQRQWEANFGRHASKGPSNIQSDSSAEVLHNPRRSAYLVPPRHDLWRTVSVDTISSPVKEKAYLEPLQRHTSVDNLRLTKVSNLRNLGSVDQHHMSSVNTVSSISSININTVNKMPRYSHNVNHRQSVESMSGYSDGESHGDGNESDVSTRTQDETPHLPSVKKLASKFDLASQERVNDLDKHETDGTLTFYGKKNIFLSDRSPTEQPYSRNLTNNLNKRIEKPYTIKELIFINNGRWCKKKFTLDM